MDLELLVVPDCPHEQDARELLRAALDDVGLESSQFRVTVVESQADADERHFVGSPAFYVDGADLFPVPGRPASLACRLYPGRAGVPDLPDLRRALKQAAAAAVGR